MPRPSPQTDRVVAVIELLSSGDEGATMTEIARHLSINPATCVHVMAALTSAGVVVREPDRRYHLGPALALGWVVFLAVMLPLTRATWQRSGGTGHKGQPTARQAGA